MKNYSKKVFTPQVVNEPVATLKKVSNLKWSVPEGMVVMSGLMVNPKAHKFRANIKFTVNGKLTKDIELSGQVSKRVEEALMKEVGIQGIQKDGSIIEGFAEKKTLFQQMIDYSFRDSDKPEFKTLTSYDLITNKIDDCWIDLSMFKFKCNNDDMDITLNPFKIHYDDLMYSDRVLINLYMANEKTKGVINGFTGKKFYDRGVVTYKSDIKDAEDTIHRYAFRIKEEKEVMNFNFLR